MTETLEFNVLIFHLKVWIIQTHLSALQNAIPLFWTKKLQPRNCVFSSLLIVFFKKKEKRRLNGTRATNAMYLWRSTYAYSMKLEIILFLFFSSRFMMSNEGKTEHVAVLYIFSECIGNGSENIWYSYMFEAFARLRSDMCFGFYPNWRRFKSFSNTFYMLLSTESELVVGKFTQLQSFHMGVCVCAVLLKRQPP